MKNTNPEKFLDTQELSALENQIIKGGGAPECKKKVKKKEVKTAQS